MVKHIRLSVLVDIESASPQSALKMAASKPSQPMGGAQRSGSSPSTFEFHFQDEISKPFHSRELSRVILVLRHLGFMASPLTTRRY